MNPEQGAAANGAFLSIVVPVYNAEKTLHACIQSVLSQTFGDYELLLIDDGSQDSSAEICRQFASSDQRIRCFSKENGGPLSARVFGAERAGGGYVGFMDADDYLPARDVFARLYRQCKAYDCDVIQFGHIKKYNHLHRTVSTVKTAQYAAKEEFRKRDYPLLLCSFWEPSRLTTTNWNKLYRRELFQNLPDSKTLDRVFWGDDLVMNIMLLSHCNSALFIPDPLYVYRQFSGGTSRFSKTAMTDLDTIKRYQLRYLATYEGENVEHIRAILFSEMAGWFNVYVKDSLRHQGREATRRMIEETLAYDTFKQARAYYQQHAENWEGAILLREGDSQAYLERAEAGKKLKMKDRIRGALKEIYYRL